MAALAARGLAKVGLAAGAAAAASYRATGDTGGTPQTHLSTSKKPTPDHDSSGGVTQDGTAPGALAEAAVSADADPTVADDPTPVQPRLIFPGGGGGGGGGLGVGVG